MDMIYKVKTEKCFQKAIESIKNSLQNHNFGVLWELNFKEKIEENDLDFDNNIQVLEVCNPKQAREILIKNIEAGFFLPCKVVVYQEDHSVFIGMVNPTGIIGLINDEKLSTIAAEVEKDLKLAIDEAK